MKLIKEVATAIAAVGIAFFAFYAVISRKLMRSVIGFALAMIFTGMLYMVFNQTFLGILQIFLYAGGVGVIAAFAYSVSDTAEIADRPAKELNILGLVAAILVATLILLVGFKLLPELENGYYQAAQMQGIADIFLDKRLFDFEIISVLLLVALVAGLSFLIRREEND